MSITQKMIKKIFAAGVILLLFSAAQAHAGSVTLNGEVLHVEPGFPVAISVNDPISLALNWEGDQNYTGEVTFAGGPNTMTLTMGDIVITEAHYPGDEGDVYPMAHISNGALDAFFVYFVMFEETFDEYWDYWDLYAKANYTHEVTSVYTPELGETEIMFYLYDGEAKMLVASAPVPLPSAGWLFGSGLLGLVGFRRKMK